MAVVTATPVFATHNDAAQMNPRGSQKEPGFFEANGNLFHDTLTYPVRAVGRIGRTAMDSPAIVRETMNGDRELLSSKGQVLSRKEAR
ncbi:MAG TPA: hypothetical protein VGO11_27585 [Chthoniobacteraceae bacterium]|nr:hypothetical protein [Chthoniobacteraceae bacterium]